MSTRPENESIDEVEKRRIEAITAKANDIIKLNVGGEKLTTKRSTLCQIEGSLLASMFSGRWEGNLERDEDGHVFVDFNPKFFILILDYLRARVIETPENPALLPEISPKEMINFVRPLDYLGLKDEIFVFDQQPPFGRHSEAVAITENGTFATCYERTEDGFILSNNTYRQSIVCWQLAISGARIFFGVLKSEPSFDWDEFEKRYGQLYKPGERRVNSYACTGSFGWLSNDGGLNVITNGKAHYVRNQNKKSFISDEDVVDLTLDCIRGTLDISILSTGREFHLTVPKLSAWKILVNLPRSACVRIVSQ